VRDQAADRAFSPSELEDFIACPQRHFLSRQLHLSEISEEVGAAAIGTLLHAVLRALFTECREEGAGANAGGLPARGVGAGVPPAPFLLPDDAPTRAAAILDACLAEYINDPRGWRREMVRHAARECLERFLEEEREYLERTGLVPSCFELAFGPQPEQRGAAPHPASRRDPLVIHSPSGDVQIAGKMDRVDLTPDGQAGVVTDYKLSRGAVLKEMLEGKSLQMPIYLLAMEQVFGIPAVAAIYRPLRKGDTYWLFRPGLVPNLRPCGRGDAAPAGRYAELVETVRSAVLQAAAGIRAGECNPTPGDICQFCPFPDVCRPDESTAVGS